MLKGQIMSEEQKLKVSLAKKGMIPWNKGKVGLQKHTEETKKRLSIINLGKPKSLETIKKMRERMIGYKFSEETKKKMSKSRTGIPRSIETKQKIREWQIANPNRIFKDTKIEIKIENELKNRKLNYQKQVPLCKVAKVDFLINNNVVIQCDGNYWHNRIGAKERDKRQDLILIANGFNVYRFWEHEINKSPEECLNKINL